MFPTSLKEVYFYLSIYTPLNIFDGIIISQPIIVLVNLPGQKVTSI